MSWVLIVQGYRGQLFWWDSHADMHVETHPHLYGAFESHHPEHMPYLMWICLCFHKEVVTIKMIEELIQLIGFISSVHWGDFLYVTVIYLLINSIPLHTHLILCEMTFYFLFICSFPFQISSFSSFCTDLHSSWLFFWNASFFLFVILLILLVIQCLLLGNICLCVCVCVWNCMLYTEFSISTHWFS